LGEEATLCGGFFNSAAPHRPNMKTIIYIDGYNLYYGAIRGTPYKWLDAVTLFERMAQTQEPNAVVTAVKFFTAPVKAKFSTRKQQATQSQKIYHRALQAIHTDRMEIIEGYFQLSRGTFPKYQHPLDKTDKVPVWRLEEKKTDVNIALHLYRDVLQERCEQVIVVSNDSDIVPALEFIKQDFPATKIGAILPRLKPENHATDGASKDIRELADWTRHYLLEEELANAQLPEKIPTNKKPILKPDYW
jgi:uncharacterized LabA/DUF88 family protein